MLHNASFPPFPLNKLFIFFIVNKLNVNASFNPKIYTKNTDFVVWLTLFLYGGLWLRVNLPASKGE